MEACHPASRRRRQRAIAAKENGLRLAEFCRARRCAEAAEGGSQDLCHLSSERRFGAIGQKGITLWMTGLSGSGKSTIARALEEALVLQHGKVVQMLDGDNVRTGLNRDLGFTPADRDESVRRVGELACLFNGGGVITLVTLVSPYRAARDAARKRHEDQGLKFLEVFMNVPIETVQKRDPKGLYEKVAKGEITSFTGMSADAPSLSPRGRAEDESRRRRGLRRGRFSDESRRPPRPSTRIYIRGDESSVRDADLYQRRRARPGAGTRRRCAPTWICRTRR